MMIEKKWVVAATLDDVWEGEMGEFEIEGEEVLVVHGPGGDVTAYQGICPHQERSLADGEFDGTTITCAAHLWEFEAATGKGINPAGCELYRYDVRLEGDDILIAVPTGGGRRYNRCAG